MAIDPEFKLTEACGILGNAHSDEDFARLEAVWSERACAVPGARLGALKMPDPLGAASYMLFTDSKELCDLVVWPTVEQIRSRQHSPEDTEAVREVLKVLGDPDWKSWGR